MTRVVLSMMFLLTVIPCVTLAEHHEPSVSDAVAHYAAIGATLAKDSTKGIAEHAKALLQMMADHRDENAAMHENEHRGMGAPHHQGHEAVSDPEQHESMEETHARMHDALTRLSVPGIMIADARATYMQLSEDFVPLARMQYEKGASDPAWAIMHCPMAKGDWIQVDGEVANPYYGSTMLRCGKKVTSLSDAEQTDTGPSTMEKEGMHSHEGGHH